MTRYIVTITPPTPNGDLHLGHLSGPFLGADVFVRARRLLGDDALLLSYSDDYQSYMVRRARERDTTVAELARENAAKIADSMQAADIGIDHFMRTYGNPRFIEAVRLFYQQAKRAGAIAPLSGRAPYCARCRQFGYEAFARGTCNFCGASSDPSQCENCARWPTVEMMGRLTCMGCKKEMGWQTVMYEALTLGDSREYLREFYSARTLRPQLRGFIDATLEQPLLDWPVTRPQEFGINVAHDGETLIHTWFSGIAGYYAALQELAELSGHPEWLGRYWYGADTRIVHFLGFDCSFSHALVYPTLLKLCDGFPQDVHLYTNAFLKLNGEDFSTSRGHAIWVRDILREVSVDALRFYLALHAPEHGKGDFVEADFRHWERHVFQEQIDRITARAMWESGAHPRPGIRPDDVELCLALRDQWRRATSHEHFSIAALASTLSEFLQYLAERAKTDDGPVAGLLGVYATMALPIHPRLSQQLLRTTDASVESLQAWLRSAGPEPELLFERHPWLSDAETDVPLPVQ